MLTFEKISENIAESIAKTMDYDENKKQVLAYGAYVLLDTILAIVMVMLIGAIFGVFVESLIVSFASALLRKTSGGVHASTPIMCGLIGAVVAVSSAVLFKNMNIFLNIYFVITFFIISFLLSFFFILKLAPKDSPNKPITKESKIKELKAKSIKTLTIYGAICIIIIVLSFYLKKPNLLIYAGLINFGYLWQALTLTSFGHLFIKIIEMPIGYIKLSGGER